MHIFNSLSRRGFLKTSAAAAAGLMAGCRVSGAGPNVLLIYADDLGYGDLGCYGSTTIDTPNLDQLAAEGIRFTDYRSTSSVCSPSRASLLTGRYPSRSGMPFAVGGVYSDLGLQEAEVTLPELLADIGYRTACIGKWHLGIPSEFDYPHARRICVHLGISPQSTWIRPVLWHGRQFQSRWIYRPPGRRSIC